MSLTSIICGIALLTIGEVGPKNMPDIIEPVESPFVMPLFERPVFPESTILVRMKQEGMSTKPIQEAIDSMSCRGGGTVVVPPGVWRTGRLILKSHVNLHLSEGAELHFSGNIIDYLPAVFTRDEGVELYSLGACLYADGQENIALTGKGKVVGPPTSCEIYNVMRVCLVTRG